MSPRNPLLLTGATGMVGRVFYRELTGYRVILASAARRPGAVRRGDQVVHADLEKQESVARLVETADPEVIVHLAAESSLDRCEQDPERARRINVKASADLARAAAQRGAYLVFASTDVVFDGEAAPYDDLDDEVRPSPLSVYGKTKLEAEEEVLAACPDALVVRFPLVLGVSPDGTAGAVDMIRTAHAERQEVSLFQDEYRTPLSAFDLGRLLMHVLRDRPSGTLHAAGPERVDRLELGRRIAGAFGGDESLLRGGSRKVASYPRPEDVSLKSSRWETAGWPMPQGLDASLAELAESAR